MKNLLKELNRTMNHRMFWLTTEDSYKVDNPTVKSYADQVLNGTITSLSGVPNTGPDRGLRDQVSQYLDQVTPDSVTPLVGRRLTMESNAIVANYINTSAYQVMSNAFPP